MRAADLALLACGALFLTGLVTGVWKYRAMITSADGLAPPYVDTCHRASLMYAFACLVLAAIARRSVWPEAVDLVAVAVPVLFFVLAIVSYAVHGVLRDTDNQLRRPHVLGARLVHGSAVSAFVYATAVGEIGGFLVLFAGALPGLIHLSA
jgi:hypothetical protein